MANPENLRTAAYLATRERLDARRRAKLKCNPPNRPCGSRCIPPDWDCRLKGEGEDPHLLAVGKGSDPVSGLANIERGISRIGKGVVKLSFSEVEGGRKAIARGTAKLAAGDLKRKSEIRKRTDKFLGALLIPASAIVGATLIHRGLNNFRGYRQGVGQRVEVAARSAIDLVKLNIPIYGARVRARREAGVAAVAAVNRITGQITSTGPDSLYENAGQRRSLGAFASQSSDVDPFVVGALNNSTSRVDRSPNNYRKPSGENYSEWHTKSLAAFWDTQRPQSVTPAGAPSGGSVFSIHAANQLLASAFELESPRGRDFKAEGTSVVDGIRRALEINGNAVRTSMQEAGLDHTNEEIVKAFIGRVGGSSSSDNQATQILVTAVRRTDYETQAKNLYGRTVSSYDQLFRRVTDDVQQAPSIDLVTERGNAAQRAALQNARRNSFFNDAVEAHSSYLASKLELPAPVYGSDSAVIARQAYYVRNVAGPNKLNSNQKVSFSLTRNQAYNAGLEIARATGVTPPSTAEAAMQLINDTYGATRHGPRGLGPISLATGTRNTTPRARPTTAAPRTAKRRLRSEAEIMQMLIRGGMSQEAAQNEAARIVAKRGDEAEDFASRLDAYLETLTRFDFKAGEQRLGKPCGNSHIPKAHECRKGNAAQPESDQGSDRKKRIAIAAAVVGGAVALGVAGSVALNLKTLQDPTKAPLEPSPSIKDLVKNMKAEAGTKSASEAMGYYYTKKSGLKPGDVVYFRNAKDPAAHYGIYLGEGKDGIVRAVVANTNEGRFSWAATMEIGSTKPGIKTSQALMTPLVKAPEPKFKSKLNTTFTNDEVVKRAIRIAGSDYKFTITKNNCEALANGIAYGVPESEQLQRFRRTTRAFVDVAVSRGQRAEARRAVYEGRAQGRSYTAEQVVAFLRGQREFSSPEGKKLAEQYEQYFSSARKDAVSSTPAGLISPDDLWSQIKTYGPAMRAQAMADYFFIQRTMLEMDRGDS